MSLRALYVDFNSYFASVEQHLRPQLRNKPIAVLPIMAETTCCIAASYEAKAFGVQTGTMVREARKLCPDIIFIEARPQLYVQFHHRLVSIIESCTHVEKILSIDEMVCQLTGSQQARENALSLAAKIKSAILEQIGKDIRCSIGIAPNTFLAKVASNMQKPDGCVVIEQHDLPNKLYTLKIAQLNGIGNKMEARLNQFGIATIQQLYAANRQQLRTAWGSVEGAHFYDKLRGIEIKKPSSPKSSLGHSRVLAPELRNNQSVHATLHQLLQKACVRLRHEKVYAATLQIKVKFLEMPSWIVESHFNPSNDTLQIIHAFETLWAQYPKFKKNKPHKVGVTFSKLKESSQHTGDLFTRPAKENKLGDVMDKLNAKFGKNTVYFAGSHNIKNNAPMRIAFNHIPDLAIEGEFKPESLL
ncbi:MAG TPA: DNA polymerase [Methylophilaceae bacterium]|jgi:DNA polymerase-4